MLKSTAPATNNPIEADFEADILLKDEGHAVGTAGQISTIARKYKMDSARLIGLLLKLDYQEMHIATCDPWKRKCGGVPRNSFVIVKVSPAHVSAEDKHFCDRIVLARVTDSVPTPVAGDALNTLFEVHKAQAMMDPYTMKELQWSAMRASIVGTFYDVDGAIAFGNDVDTFFGAHAYEVYSPSADDLGSLINSFVATAHPLEIGRLRYTETPSAAGEMNVPIKVDVRDFVGISYGHRTALFGKTRFGKSNTIKVIADTILRSHNPPGQIIFDPSGEYTYWNEQDGGSLFLPHRNRSERYSIQPKAVPQEVSLNIPPPRMLKLNFYEAVSYGHNLIVSLWDETHPGNPPPGYILPITEWAPLDPADAPVKSGATMSAYNHYWRTMSLWFGVLRLAGFSEPSSKAPVDFPKDVKQLLAAESGVKKELENGSFAAKQPIGNLPSIYRKVQELWESQPNLFATTSGDPYFSDLEVKLLTLFKADPTKKGANYFLPFNKFHDPQGSSLFAEISAFVRAGKTVFIETARANEIVRTALSERICRQVLGDMMEDFSTGTLGDSYVVLYFEEAHTLFNKDDSDLNSVYNKIAKEGAKFHISMVYATQSMTTLSPDLLKNTENFFIAHLDDDREVKEVTRKYVFRDMAEDVQRTQSKGYVRMITASHRFALPVQIRKFTPEQ